MRSAKAFAFLAVLGGSLISSDGRSEDYQWPLIKDLSIGAGLPSGTRAETNGIEIGRTFSEISELLKAKYPEAEPSLSEGAYPLSDDEKDTIKWSQFLQVSADDDAREMYEDVQIGFVSPLNGHRAYYVNRAIEYEKESSYPFLSDSYAQLISKFGEPSIEIKHENSASQIYVYLYKDGDKTKIDYYSDRLTDIWSKCALDRFIYEQPRTVSVEDCAYDVAIVVDVTTVEPSSERYKRLSLTVLDMARLRLHLESSDQHIRSERERLLRDNRPVPPPL